MNAIDRAVDDESGESLISKEASFRLIETHMQLSCDVIAKWSGSHRDSSAEKWRVDGQSTDVVRGHTAASTRLRGSNPPA